MHDECLSEMICGQPWFRISYTGNRDYNFWIPAEPFLSSASHPKLTLTAKTNISEQETRFFFRFGGPSYMNIQISPLEGVQVVSWSFFDQVVAAGTWNNRPVYFINYIHGHPENFWKNYDFDVTIRRPPSWSASYSFDIALSAMYIEDEEYKTAEFREFTQSFPTWTNVQNWTASYTSYQY